MSHVRPRSFLTMAAAIALTVGMPAAALAADGHGNHDGAHAAQEASSSRADELARLAGNLFDAASELPESFDDDESLAIRQAMANLILADLEFNELSIEEFEALGSGYVVEVAGRTREILPRLRELAQDESINGLKANVVAMNAVGAHNYFNEGDQLDDATGEFFSAALAHPAMATLWEDADNAWLMMNVTGGARNFPEETAQNLDKLYELAESAPGDLPRSHIRAANTLFTALASNYDPAYAERHERIRVKFAAYEQDERFTALYDSAFGRGEFFNETAPDVTFLWSSDSEISSLGDLTGSVVVVDFWATWCGPCIASFPNVRDLQDHYEGYPVVVLGVTSPQGAHFGEEGRTEVESNDEEFALMGGFMEWREMTWPVVFTEESVFNPDYGVQGIPHVTVLDTQGRVRHNGLHPGMDLPGKVEKINKLLEEAGLATPGPLSIGQS